MPPPGDRRLRAVFLFSQFHQSFQKMRKRMQVIEMIRRSVSSKTLHFEMMLPGKAELLHPQRPPPQDRPARERQFL